MATRPWLYRAYSSYCFGAKQCFWLRICDIFNTESAWNRLFLCSFSDEQAWPASPSQPGQTASSWKQAVPVFSPFAVFKKSNIWKFRFLSALAHFMPISVTERGTTTGYGAKGWCQARGIRLLYSLAGASGTHVGKTFPFRILLSLARMLWMCHSREVPHFNILYSFFVDFFFLYQTLLHVLLFCLPCFSLKIIIQIISIFWELPYPWSYLLLFEFSEVLSLWDDWRWLDHSSLLEVVPQIHVKIPNLFIVLQPILSVCLLYLHTKSKAGWHLVAKAVI